VVYLNSTPDELFRRLKHDKSRPLLQVADPLGRLRELHRQRDPLYRETCHFSVDTGRPSVSSLVQLIASRFGVPTRVRPGAGDAQVSCDLSVEPALGQE